MAIADLTSLPMPDIIDTLDYEVILADRIAHFKEKWAEARINEPDLPSYDVELLETDPVLIVLQETAFREMLLRARVNDAARANLIAFSLGADLDHLATFYDVARLDSETDDALRGRTILAIQARSPGGSPQWYAAAARRADVRIRDVVVYREEFLPIIHIAILSSENDGVPDQAMLDAVTAEVMSDAVRLLNDTIIVEPAVTRGTDIEVNIWLLPTAPLSTVDGLSATLRTAWNVETGVGFDLVPSWIEARLHVAGIQRVQIVHPVAAIIAEAGSAISIGSIKLNYMGRDY